MRTIRFKGALSLAVLCSAALLAGCASTPDTTAATAQRQDQAIKDPMGYSPNMEDTDITGGGLGAYDNKAMMRDVNDVLNP